MMEGSAISSLSIYHAGWKEKNTQIIGKIKRNGEEESCLVRKGIEEYLEERREKGEDGCEEEKPWKRKNKEKKEEEACKW